MTDVMLTLSDFRSEFQFKLDTMEFQTMERRHKQLKAVLPRIGRKSATQHLGTDVGTIKLPGVILPHWKGGFHQLSKLYAMADAGKPYRLIDGMGRNLGRWEIVEVGEKNEEYFMGAPTKINFDIDLHEYGEDGMSGIELLNLLMQMIGGLF